MPLKALATYMKAIQIEMIQPPKVYIAQVLYRRWNPDSSIVFGSLLPMLQKLLLELDKPRRVRSVDWALRRNFY